MIKLNFFSQYSLKTVSNGPSNCEGINFLMNPNFCLCELILICMNLIRTQSCPETSSLRPANQICRHRFLSKAYYEQQFVERRKQFFGIPFAFCGGAIALGLLSFTFLLFKGTNHNVSFNYFSKKFHTLPYI